MIDNGAAREIGRVGKTDESPSRLPNRFEVVEGNSGLSSLLAPGPDAAELVAAHLAHSVECGRVVGRMGGAEVAQVAADRLAGSFEEGGGSVPE